MIAESGNDRSMKSPRKPSWRRSLGPDADTSSTVDLILATARRLLIEHGYRALTFDSVAQELGCDKGTIAYHFGNKMGLVTAVQDSLVHDILASIMQDVRETAGKTDTSTVAKAILVATDARGGWLDVMPYAIRNPELRKIHADLYLDLYQQVLEWFDLASATPGLSKSLLTRFAAAAVAVTDGLAIQIGLGTIDLDEAALAVELVLDGTRSLLADSDEAVERRLREGRRAWHQNRPSEAADAGHPDAHDGATSSSVEKASSTAAMVLTTAKTLLFESGYDALSFETVAKRAGVHRDTIRYHFRNKMGLVTAVQDSLVHDILASIMQDVRETAGKTDTSTVAKAILVATDARGGWLDVMPYAIRNPELRKIHADLYLDLYQQVLEWFDLASATPGLSKSLLTRFAAAAVAVTDGLAIQIGLGTIDLDEAALAVELVLDGTVVCLGESQGR